MQDKLIDDQFARLVTEDRPAAEILALLLDHDVIVLCFPAADGESSLQAAVTPGEHGQLTVAFTSAAQLAASTSDRGNLEPMAVRLRSFLENIPPDVGLMINPGCNVSRVIEWPFIQDAFPTFGAAIILQEPTEAWLSEVNLDLATKDVPPEGRPWQAFSAYELASGFPVALGSARAKRIFDWFERNTKPGTQIMPPFMLFAYYFDASFWSSPMPVIFGQPSVNPYDSIQMPPHVFQRLLADSTAALEYARYWALCYDYAYGTDDFLKTGATAFALNLAVAARDQMTAATALLLEQQPNIRALEASALAMEMVLKLFLAVRDGLTDETARKQYRHGIPDLLSRCTTIAPAAGFASVVADTGVFPPTAERYQKVERSRGDLWRGYALAVRTGAVVMNELTDRHQAQQSGAL